MSSLPSSWICASLASIAAKITKGTTPTTNGFRFQSNGVNFIKVENLRDGKIALNSIKQFISEEAHRAQMRSALQVGDVLFSIAGTIGEIAIVEEKHLPANTNQALAIISGAGNALEPKFLEFQLKSLNSQDVIARARGGTMNNISLGDLREMRIVVAPKNEQRRIVAKIEELFSELDKGIESLVTAREHLKAYRQSVLNKAVFGETKGSQCFPTRMLSSVVVELGQGWSPRCLNHPATDERAWAVITTTAIQHGIFREQENKQLPEELEPRPHLAIQVGDILVTRAGPRKRVGVACLVRHCRPRLMLCDKAYRLRVNTDDVLPEWLELVLNSPSILQEIEKLKTGISDSGVNLTQNRFLKLEMPIPGVAEQKAVLTEVDSLTSQMTNLETQIETAMRQSAALRQSILKHAFSGQLVTQDPADEPASILLERIRAAREEGGATKRRNKKSSKRIAA